MNEIEFLEAFDDIAHNRLLEMKNGKFKKIKNYGKRNKKARCYCKEVKSLRRRNRR